MYPTVAADAFFPAFVCINAPETSSDHVCIARGSLRKFRGDKNESIVKN
jgi:hypothetical protein